eukprot:1090931-Pleurochrysis_carterae.AAC.1
MGVMCTTTHSCPSLAAQGRIHLRDAHVMSLLPSNSRPRGWPSSPPRRRALWASSAAAHSSRSR